MDFDDELQIRELTRQMTNLMIAGNTYGLDELLDDDFTLTHITGYVQSKKEWLREIESEQMKYYSAEEVKTGIRIDGDHATFAGRNLLDARIRGSRSIWRLQQIIQLNKRNNQWIILDSVASIF